MAKIKVASKLQSFFINNRLSDTHISWYGSSMCSHMRTMSQTLQNTTADTVFKFFVQWKLKKDILENIKYIVLYYTFAIYIVV